MSKRDIGIDLGTANTLIYLKSKGIVLNEPSVVAVDNKGRVLAVGSEAKEMLGRTHSDIRAVRPLQKGVISDFEYTAHMLKFFIKKLMGNGSLLKPKAVICVPGGVSSMEQKAVEEAALSSGLRSAHIVKEPMAAAIGAGLNVNAPCGTMIVDIGGGTCEVAIISLGGIVKAKSVTNAGDSHDDAIISYIRKKYGIIIGEHNAEDLKIKIGTVQKSSDEYRDIAFGRNASSGMPGSCYVTSSDVKTALTPLIYSIIETIKAVLSEAPPELSSDILKTGITLCGGGSLLNGIDRVICSAVNIPVRLAENPLECVAIGAGRIIDKKLNF